MKHELVQARDATGMQLRGQNSMLCGYYRGFAVVTNLNSRARCYDVIVWASRPGVDMTAEANQWLGGYISQHPVCLGGSYDGRVLTAQIAMDKKRDITAQSLIAFYNDVTGWMAANSMTSGCGSCGAQDTALYEIGGRAVVLCPRCLEQMTRSAQENQRAVPGNLPAGIVGALIFSLAGVALWVIVNRMGYVAAICGLVLMVCAFKGYEIFGKKLDMPGIIASVLVALFMGLVSQFICIGLDAYEVFSEYGIGLLECMRAVPALLADPEMELLSAYLPQLLMGYAFMAVGSFSFVRNAIAAQKHGGVMVEKLAQGPIAPAANVNSYNNNIYQG